MKTTRLKGRDALRKIKTTIRITGRKQLQQLMTSLNVFDGLPSPDGHDSTGEPFWNKATIQRHCQSAMRVRLPID